jgi:ribonucleoside-diphosphate reductase alpha chain
MDKKYTYDEVLKASVDYFSGNEVSAKVFTDKYALRDKENNFCELTPDDMHKRLASEFARIDRDKYGLDYDERYNVYYSVMINFAGIIPQGSVMSAVGNPYQIMSASNCVVIESPEDDLGDIIEKGKDLAQLYKRRAGCGIDLSTLRPEGAMVNNAARATSGAWSFCNLYSDITRLVGQNSRRGACLLALSVHHPDVIKFSTMKQDRKQVTGANISVKLSDEFLNAVEADIEYEQRWPIDSNTPKISKMVRAKDIWDIIIESAATAADPGLLFWDTITRNLPAHCYKDFRAICVNPCSELILSAFDACRLISMNLTGYVVNAFTDSASFDLDKFEKDIRIAIQMADNLVDLEIELIQKIKEVSKSDVLSDALARLSNNKIKKMFDMSDKDQKEFCNIILQFKNTPNERTERALWDRFIRSATNGRRIGLGTHALGDTLAQLGIKYDSTEAVDRVKEIYEVLRNAAYDASIDLSKDRGSFPVYNYELEKDCEFIKRLPESLKEKMIKNGRRNISILTMAPTGSVSMISKVGGFNLFNTSSGIEPVFRFHYTRKKKIDHDDQSARIDFIDEMGDKWQEFEICHSNLQAYYEVCGKTDELPDYFITSEEVKWDKRLDVQAAAQIYIDHAISNTVNFPRGTTPETVGKVYWGAWKRGLKGVTVYVEGTRDGILVSDAEKDSKGRPKQITKSSSPKRPKELPCEIHHAIVDGEKWSVLIGMLAGSPYEVFLGKTDKFEIPVKYTEGKIVKAKKSTYNLLSNQNDVLVENIIDTADNDTLAWVSRMISMSLRHGVPVEYIVDQLSKDGTVVDFNNVMARLLKKYIKNRDRKKETCPQCGGPDIIYSEGCKKCACGWSGCS